MADTAIAITAGSGTNVDTRTEATNGNHRQVVVLGDPATNAGVAPVDATLGLSVQVTNANANGQATMANSAPVALASNQSTLPVQALPATSGGLTVTSIVTTAAAVVGNVKASAGQLYKIEVSNNSASWVYLKMYNTAGTPTAGAGTPARRLGIPPSSVLLTTSEIGGAYATGIGYAIVGGATDADSSAVAANVLVNFFWK